MTNNESFGRDLSRWLHEEGEHRVPDHLAEVLVQTASTRQRPWWSSPERWLPMDTSSLRVGRATVRRIAFLAATVVALVGALLGAAVMSGAIGRTEPAPAGVGNGRIIVADGSAIVSYAPDGTDRQVIVRLSAPVGSVDLSPDGRRLAMEVQTAPGHVEVLDLDTKERVPIPTEPAMDVGSLNWSPDGTALMFAGFDGTDEHLFVAPVDGTAATELVFPSIARGSGYYPADWSPTGDEIAFVVTRPGSGQGTLYASSPSGSGLRELVADRVLGDSADWSSAPGGAGIVYTAAGNRIEVVDPVSKDVTSVGGGFWPTWSPDGTMLAYWDGGTRVATTNDALADPGRYVRVFPAIAGSCQDHPELAGKAFCGLAFWSPDGMRLIAADITGDSILSLMADGSGSPIRIALSTNVMDSYQPVAWRPIQD